MLHAQPYAFDVDRHDPVEQRFVHVGDLVVLFFDAGVVEGAVELPERVHGGGHQRRHLIVAAHVGGAGAGVTAGPADRLGGGFGGVGVDVGHHQTGAVAAQFFRRGAADTAARAGDQHCFIFHGMIAHVPSRD